MFTLNVTKIYLAPKKVNVSSNEKNCFDIVIQKWSFYVQKSWPFIERILKYNFGNKYISMCDSLQTTNTFFLW
jgi:hypothetical protein